MSSKVRWFGVALVAGAILATCLSGTADAQKKKKGEDVTEEKAAEQKGMDIKDLVTAYELAEFGRKNKAPEALITAAGLMRRLSKIKMEAITEKPTVEVDKDAPVGTKPVDEADKAPDLAAEANALFDEAQVLGAQLKLDLDPLINQAKTRALTRAAVGGPKRASRVIGSHATHTFHYKLYANMPTHFGFQTNIPLHVRVNAAGGQVLVDGTFPYGNAVWFPAGRKVGAPVAVTIHIRNNTRQRAHYQFFMN